MSMTQGRKYEALFEDRAHYSIVMDLSKQDRSPLQHIEVQLQQFTKRN